PEVGRAAKLYERRASPRPEDDRGGVRRPADDNESCSGARRRVTAASEVPATSSRAIAINQPAIEIRRNEPMRSNRRTQRWSKPKFIELRFGFEVTMYSEYR